MNDLSAIASEARGLMDTHGLAHWTFQWDNAKLRMGCCFYGPKIISISAPLARRTPLSEVRDTILHEIAHAMAGRGTGHGPVWKRVAALIGCSAERCYDASKVEPLPGKWQATCPSCGKVFHKHRMVRREASRYHRPCGPENGSLVFKAVR